ncbi:uncharacterized protein LOC107043849 isoform X2 [Diachasma alloeum]|uniref:uncharacterized protein LOC107043849 isoform X2 n=1 Tax=Diachasma alloeum TaxID=454923 RepID=UPI000738101B|nr:uncharacterized protein LOC107043849 isoform X2 [Diachasma alloeum]
MIERHGGTVALPGERTLILSAPDRPRGTQFLQFDVKWLYDSIKHSKRQDIGKYLLPAVPLNNNSKQTPTFEKPSEVQIHDSCEFEADPRQNVHSHRMPAFINHTEQMKCNDEINSDAIPEAKQSTNALGHASDGSSAFVNFTRDFSESNKPSVLFPEVKKYKSLMPNAQSIDINIIPALSRMDVTDDNSRAIDKSINHKRKDISFFDDINESDAVVNGCWRFASKTNDTEKIHDTEVNYYFEGETDSPTTKSSHPSSDFNDNDCQMDVGMTAHNECSETVPLKPTLDKSVQIDSLRDVRFSREDDLKIVKYLIDKNAISRIQGASVWFQMEYDKILPNRAAATLRYRFEEKLIDNISRYTDDPVALKQFNAFKPGAQDAKDCSNN